MERGRDVDVCIEDPTSFIIFTGKHSSFQQLQARINAVCAEMDRSPPPLSDERINTVVMNLLRQKATLTPVSPGEPAASNDRFLRAAQEIRTSRSRQPYVVICERGIVKNLKGQPTHCDLLWLPAGSNKVLVVDAQGNLIESISGMI